MSTFSFVLDTYMETLQVDPIMEMLWGLLPKEAPLPSFCYPHDCYLFLSFLVFLLTKPLYRF